MTTTTTALDITTLRPGQQFVARFHREDGTIFNEEVVRFSRHEEDYSVILRTGYAKAWVECVITHHSDGWVSAAGNLVTARPEHTITIADLITELTDHHDTDALVDQAQQIIIERAVTAGFLPTSETRLGEDFAEGVRSWWFDNVLI